MRALRVLSFAAALAAALALSAPAAAQVVRAGSPAPAAPATPAPPATTPAPAAAPAPERPQSSAHREYLQRFVLVLDGIRRSLRWVEMHPGNEALARFTLPLIQEYVTMTGHMTPTEDLRLLHPHLLLVAENAECAVAAQGAGDVRGYRAHIRTVREELRTLESVLHHLEIELPEIPR